MDANRGEPYSEERVVTHSILENVDIERLQQWDAGSLLRYAFEVHGQRAAIGTSLQKTGTVAIHMAHTLGVPFRVFFIDTLLNNPETYEFCGEVEQQYGISIERFAPTEEEIEALYREWGQYAHYVNRTRCCRVRKTLPLHRAMNTLDAWIAGLRADQSAFRGQKSAKVSWVSAPWGHKILKVNPLFDWTAEQIDRYSQEHEVPRNKLYDYVSPYGERFTIIGCRTCHIPVKEELEPRAGKFPWEQGHSECGLHLDGDGI